MSQLADHHSPDKRIVLGLEYDGSGYSGWQKQLATPKSTIQQRLEQALSKIEDHTVSSTCAGRTDAGVHATCQVIHFDCSIDRGAKAWVQGTNSLLPPTIRVLWARTAVADFHARFSATARRYFYIIAQRDIAPAILSKRVTHVREKLNVAAMHEAAQHLLGEKDFTSFRAAGCQSKTANRNVMGAQVTLRSGFIVLDIEANAFLQHMVRNIMGTLLEVGAGAREPEWVIELLAKQDRCEAAATAPADGLYLMGVSYPKKFALPSTTALPPFVV